MLSNTRSFLNFYKYGYPLKYEECPCDVDLVDWLKLNAIDNPSIFHFGTGSHHYIGRHADASVLAITASVREYEEYMRASIENPRFCERYKVLFGDIYQLDARLLPCFDIVSLFHLCEFRTEQNANYGAMTDLELVNLFTDKITPEGYLCFYTGSDGFQTHRQPNTREIIDSWQEKNKNFEKNQFKSLEIYQKIV